MTAPADVLRELKDRAVEVGRPLPGLRGNARPLLLAGVLLATAFVLVAGERSLRLTLAALAALIAAAVLRRRFRRPDGSAWEYEPPAAPAPPAAEPIRQDVPVSADERLLTERLAALEELRAGVERALADVDRRSGLLAEKSHALRAQSVDIAAAELELRERERELARGIERVEDEHKRLARLERALYEATLDITTEEMSAADRLERREELLSEAESVVRERAKSLDEREGGLQTRQARFEADLELRSFRVARGEKELADLEQRLAERARELDAYVAQLQRGLRQERAA